MSDPREKPTYKYEYEKQQRDSNPINGGCNSIDECYEATLADFVLPKPRFPILISCVCTDNTLINDIQKQFCKSLSQKSLGSPLPVYDIWYDYENQDARTCIYYCADTLQQFYRDGNILGSYLEIPSQLTENLSEIAWSESVYSQCLAPLLLHYSSPFDLVEDIGDYFFGKRHNLVEEERLYNKNAKRILGLLATQIDKTEPIEFENGESQYTLRFIAHFPYDHYDKLCQILDDSSSLILDRVVKITPKDPQPLIDRLETGSKSGNYTFTREQLEQILRIVNDQLTQLRNTRTTLETDKDLQYQEEYLCDSNALDTSQGKKK